MPATPGLQRDASPWRRDVPFAITGAGPLVPFAPPARAEAPACPGPCMHFILLCPHLEPVVVHRSYILGHEYNHETMRRTASFFPDISKRTN